MSSVEFIQRKIQQQQSKVQQQVTNLQNKQHHVTPLKKGTLSGKKQPPSQPQQQKIQLGSAKGVIGIAGGPSPSTTAAMGIPDDSQQQYQDDTQSGLFDDQHYDQQQQQQFGQYQPNQQDNYEFDHLNDDNRAELIHAIEDLEHMGANELSYLYNMGQQLQLQDPFGQFDQYNTTTTTTAGPDGDYLDSDGLMSYGMNLSGNQSFFNRSTAKRRTSKS